MAEPNRDLTSKKNINSLRLYLLQYLLKATDETKAINITDAGKYLLEAYGVVLHRETLTKMLKELYANNDIFKESFQFEIVRIGNGNKLRYYTKRFLGDDEIADLCIAIDREVMVLPDRSEQITSKLQNMLSTYDEDRILDILNRKKKKSSYSVFFEDYLKLAKSAMRQKQVVRIEYYNDIHSLRKEGHECYSNNSCLFKIEGYILDIVRIFNAPYIKIVNMITNQLKYISLFDIACIEKILTYTEDVTYKNLEVLDDSIELCFCLENASDNIPFTVKFKELFDFTIESSCSEKYITFVTNRQRKTKRVLDFLTIEDCERYMAESTNDLEFSAPEKRQYYQVVLNKELAIKWLMSPEVWGNILIIRPMEIVNEMYDLSLKLMRKLKDNYTCK